MDTINEDFAGLRIGKPLERSMSAPIEHGHDSANSSAQHSEQYEDPPLSSSHQRAPFANPNVTKRSKEKDRRTSTRVEIEQVETDVSLTMRQTILADRVDILHAEHVGLEYQNRSLETQNQNMELRIASLEKTVKYELASKQDLVQLQGNVAKLQSSVTSLQGEMVVHTNNMANGFASVMARLDVMSNTGSTASNQEKQEIAVSKESNMHLNILFSPTNLNIYTASAHRSGLFESEAPPASRIPGTPEKRAVFGGLLHRNDDKSPLSSPEGNFLNRSQSRLQNLLHNNNDFNNGFDGSRGRQPYNRHQRGNERQSNHSRSRTRALLPPSKPDELRGVVLTRQDQFKVTDVGFFYPWYTEDKNSIGYVVSGKEVIYTSVQLFVQTVKQYVVNNEGVLKHLYFCLRGAAQIWWAGQNPTKQLALLATVDTFCNALVTRYEEHPIDALRKMQAESYTIKDAQKRRQPDEYVSLLMRYAVPLDMSDLAVLSMAWGALDKELRRHVRRPDKRTTTEDFIRDLEDAAGYYTSSDFNREDEKEAAYQRGVKSGQKQNPERFERYSESYTGGYSTNYPSRPQGAQPSRNWQAPSRNAYTPAPSQNRPQYSQQNQAPATQNLPPPQRTSQYPTRTTQYPMAPPAQKLLTNNASYNAFVPASYEQYDYNADSGYDEEQAQAVNEDTKFETPEHANFGDITTSFHAEAPELETFNDEVYTRHGMPPMSCNICKQSYLNNGGRARLDNHMMVIHGVDIKSSQSMDQKRYTNWMEHAALHVVTIRGPPSERGYATIQARLYDEGNEEIPVCIDIGSSVSFIDESLLPEGNLWSRLHNCHSITVRGIAGERIVDKQMDIPLFVTATDGTMKRIEVKVYVSKGIKAGVILGMDELGKAEDDIALWLGRKKMQLGDCHVAINFTSRGSQPVSFFADSTPRSDYTGPRSCLKSFGGRRPVRKTVRFAEIMAKSPYKSARFSGSLTQANAAKTEEFQAVYGPGIAELKPLAIARSSAFNFAGISVLSFHQRAGPANLNWRARSINSDPPKRSTMGFALGSRRRNLNGPWRNPSN